MKKVVLAFSGGLDTSYCVLYLKKVLGLEVHTICVNTGGFNAKEEQAIKKHAIALGVKSHITVNEKNNYYRSCIKYLIFGNILKNGTYPLSVSAERIAQAMAVANYVKRTKAHYVAHGSTGAGNDQVRFDMIFNIMIPKVEILTPIRDNNLSRQEEIDFLKANGVKMNFSKALYSINKGLWGTSVGGKETLTSHLPLPDSAYPTAVTRKVQKKLLLHFKKGELIGVGNKQYADPVKAIEALDKIASPYGIGRDVHVGDTIIGIKGRVGFEAAAPTLIIKAHHALEKHTLTKWQLYWKDQLAAWYGNWLHEGQLLDPVMRDIEKFLENSQKTVTGTVEVLLMQERFKILGINSKHDLMSSEFGAYGEENTSWSGEDVKGFTKMFGNQVSIYHKINKN